MVERRALFGRMGCNVSSRLAIRRARCSPPYEPYTGTFVLDVDGCSDDAATFTHVSAVDRCPQHVGKAASCHGGISHGLFCALAAVGNCCRMSAGTTLDALLHCAGVGFSRRRLVATDVKSQKSFHRMPSHPTSGASRLAGGSRLSAFWRNHRHRLRPELLAIDASLHFHGTQSHRHGGRDGCGRLGALAVPATYARYARGDAGAGRLLRGACSPGSECCTRVVSESTAQVDSISVCRCPCPTPEK